MAGEPRSDDCDEPDRVGVDLLGGESARLALVLPGAAGEGCPQRGRRLSPFIKRRLREAPVDEGPHGFEVSRPGLAQVARQCADVSLSVNNAGVLKYSAFISAPGLDAAQALMETNYFARLSLCRAFAPVLAANGGGTIVNMLSVTSFFTNLIDASYGASKAAAWSLTNGIRIELHHQVTLVVAVHATFIDTDMAAPATNVPKDSPDSIAQQTFDAGEAGQVEVLADERTRTVKAKLSRDQELIYPPLQKFWDDALKGGS
jgi:NAD(P)-dependent dehydrogenase (short-subunit alcohol dehydrogenase family)